MGLSKTKYKCSKCGRVYDYHNHAVYVDTQSQTLVMKCPTDGAVAFWYDGEISSYEVEGAFDLMDVKVDNESKSIIFTMNRDETKQDKLTVKTDTPETVDISLEKDVLQVDVKSTGTSNSNNFTMITPINSLNVSYVTDDKKVDFINLDSGVEGEIISVVYENEQGNVYLKQEFDLHIPVSDMEALFNSENPFVIGMNVTNNDIKKYYDTILVKNGFAGLNMYPAYIDFVLSSDEHRGIVRQEHFSDYMSYATVKDIYNGEEKEYGELDIYISPSQEFSKFMKEKYKTLATPFINVRNIKTNYLKNAPQ